MHRLKFNLISNSLFSRLSTISKNNSHLDTTILCQDNIALKANKTILSVFSPYFEKMFCHFKANLIAIPTIRHDVCESFLQLIHEGEVEIGTGLLEEVKVCFQLFEIEEIFPGISQSFGKF